jgi:hypothetical protein
MAQPTDGEATMRIGWIGGVERSETDLVRLAKSSGHHLFFHSGHMAGRGSQDLKNLVERSDLVIILTDVNSHGAVIAARRIVREQGKASMVVRRLGASRFSALLEALDRRRDGSRPVDTTEPLLKTGS